MSTSNLGHVQLYVYWNDNEQSRCGVTRSKVTGVITCIGMNMFRDTRGAKKIPGDTEIGLKHRI